MKLTQFLLAACTAVAASASPTDDGEFFSVLLKRQEPGTPAYDCHNNCGQAIIQAREGGDGVCEDDGFVSNYNNCLECAGPDNFNIWQYYGNTLSAAGEACGFETEPASGSGDDEGDDEDSSPTVTDDVSPSVTSPPDAEPTDDEDASEEDDGNTPSESDDGSEEPTSGDDAEPSSPSTDAAGVLRAGFVGIAVAATCAGGLLM